MSRAKPITMLSHPKPPKTSTDTTVTGETSLLMPAEKKLPPPPRKRKFAVEFPDDYGSTDAPRVQLWPEVDRLWMPSSRERQETLSPVAATVESVSDAWRVCLNSLCYFIVVSFPACHLRFVSVVTLKLFSFFEQSLQSALATRHHVIMLEDQIVKLKNDMKKAKQEAGRLGDVAKEATARAEALQVSQEKGAAEVAQLNAEKETLVVQVDELKTSLSKVKARIYECAGYYTWKMKAEMMEEFKAGKHVNWTPDEDIAQFNTAFPEDYIPPGAVSDEEDVEEGATATSPDVETMAAPGDGEQGENAGPADHQE